MPPPRRFTGGGPIGTPHAVVTPAAGRRVPVAMRGRVAQRAARASTAAPSAHWQPRVWALATGSRRGASDLAAECQRLSRSRDGITHPTVPLVRMGGPPKRSCGHWQARRGVANAPAGSRGWISAAAAPSAAQRPPPRPPPALRVGVIAAGERRRGPGTPVAAAAPAAAIAAARSLLGGGTGGGLRHARQRPG